MVRNSRRSEAGMRGGPGPGDGFILADDLRPGIEAESRSRGRTHHRQVVLANGRFEEIGDVGGVEEDHGVSLN